MPKKYTLHELNKKKEAFSNYLRENPEASFKDACRAGHFTVLKSVYDLKINAAKKKLKIPIAPYRYPRLTEEEREEIAILATCGVTHPSLGEEYGVSEELIYKISRKLRKNVKHTPGRYKPSETLANAINTYLTTSNDKIKKSIERLRFLPMAERMAKDCSNFLSAYIERYNRLLYAVSGERIEASQMTDVKKITDTIINELKSYIQYSAPKAEPKFGEMMSNEIQRNVISIVHNSILSIHRSKIQGTISTLPEKDQRIITLRFLESDLFPFEEIGNEFGVTREGIQQKAERLLERMCFKREAVLLNQ